MEPAAVSSLLVLLMLSSARCSCRLSHFTLFVEKPECDFCVAINTSICTGYCRTTDSIMRTAIGPILSQSSCMYDRVEYRTQLLPGCSDAAVFSYPVALSCHCGTCSTENHECSPKHRPAAAQPGLSCSKPVLHIHPDLGHTHYSTPF